jgi:hypothetical protein
MMKNRRILTVFVFTCFFSPGTYAGWLGGPSDYDECILEGMKGVTSDVAAQLIRQSCQKKFPKKTHEDNSVELPSSALEKIEGKAGVAGNGYYEGIIFNGNREWHITSLTVRLEDSKSKQYRDYEASVKQGAYSYSLPPLTKGEFSFKPYEVPKERIWSILSGRGYKK